MNCPRCQHELVPQELFTGGRHATVAGCLNCGGQWMRDTDLQRLSEIVEPVVIELLAVSPASQREVLHCPEDEGSPPLRKLRSDRDARVVLDTCDVCGGVWLDGGELRAIQQESLPALAGALLRSKAPRSH